MILDKERLEMLIFELFSSDGVQESLRKRIAFLIKEIGWLKKDSGHETMIRELSLPGVSISDMPKSSSGIPKDLTECVIEIEKHREKYEKDLVCCVEQCYTKKFIFHRIEEIFRHFPQNEREYYVDCFLLTVNACNEKHRHSKKTIREKKEEILNMMLEVINKEIADLPDYQMDEMLKDWNMAELKRRGE